MRILEDTDLCWRVQLAGTPLIFADRAVVHVRLRSTLSGMWRQGWGYGHADALLEERYGPAAAAAPDRVIRSTGRLRRLAGLGRLINRNRSPQALVWTLLARRHRAFTRQERLMADPDLAPR